MLTIILVNQIFIKCPHTSLLHAAIFKATCVARHWHCETSCFAACNTSFIHVNCNHGWERHYYIFQVHQNRTISPRSLGCGSFSMDWTPDIKQKALQMSSNHSCRQPCSNPLTNYHCYIKPYRKISQGLKWETFYQKWKSPWILIGWQLRYSTYHRCHTLYSIKVYSKRS